MIGLRAVLISLALVGAAHAEPSHIAGFGGFTAPESAVYDANSDVYIVTNIGSLDQSGSGYISLVAPDGHTLQQRWITNGANAAILDHPLGSEIFDSTLYVVDTGAIRRFDLATGLPLGSTEIAGTTMLNDLGIAPDGTIYVTDTGSPADSPDGAIYRIAPDGTVSLFATGSELANPNGIAINASGNIVTVSSGAPNMQIRSPSGRLLRTIDLPFDQNDGLIALADGGFFVSSIRGSAVMHVGSNGAVEIIATDISNPASIGLDLLRNRIIIPQLWTNSISFFDTR